VTKFIQQFKSPFWVWGHLKKSFLLAIVYHPLKTVNLWLVCMINPFRIYLKEKRPSLVHVVYILLYSITMSMSTFFCVDNHIFFVNLSEVWIRRVIMLKIDDKIRHLIELALVEDIGKHDLTSEATIDQNLLVKGTIVAKEEGIIAGLEIAKMVFQTLDPNLVFESSFKDGDKVTRKDAVAILKGRAKSILSAERTALNFLQRLSGIATLTSKYVEKIKDTGVKILDTRKTTPGFRALEKYAVKMGGGENHRMGLFDMILIKENHIKAVGSIAKAIQKAKAKYPNERIEMETRNLNEVAEAVNSGADWIMLDNMSIEEMKKAVKMIRSSQKEIKIEASGGVSLNNVRGMALTGVDFISVGALTHSAPALDFSLLLVE
jgi:nicotinate-nucleotide pyrophosphorylase (carboxylating)